MTDTDQEFSDATLDKIESEENFDECTFKIEEVLSLIFGEIKKIDAIIQSLNHSKGNQDFLPTIEETKEYVKSINKDNSLAYRVIIDDLKKQKREINEMQEFYNCCTQEFSKLEDGQKRKFEQIKEMRTSLDRIMEYLDCVENKKNNHPNEEDLKIRDENHERIFAEMVKWISELNEAKLKEEAKENSRVNKLEIERNQDRAMLISVVKQIQEVNKIKSIIETNGLQDKTSEASAHSKTTIDIADENKQHFSSNAFCCGNLSYSNSSEMKINLEKPKKSMKKKNLFPKIFQQSRLEKKISDVEMGSVSQKNMENHFIPVQSYGCQNPILLGPYNSVKNYLFRKDIPFYLKLIGRNPERNKIKFMKIGNQYLSVE